MILLRTIFLTLIVACAFNASSQDTLPNFSARNVGNNRIILGWINNYKVVKQISIQRSHDSLINFKTILTVADPAAIQNGFADTKAPNDHMYYRLFINLEKGEFFFTPSKQPVWDTARKQGPVVIPVVIEKPKDTTAAAVVPKPVIKKPEFVPSFYVYTNKNGYVFINLPDADKKKYHIKFFEDDESFLFEIRNIKETGLTLDKTNFLHSGWFHFELYNEDKLIEKHKFFLPKEF
jgi:hypothetical protein